MKQAVVRNIDANNVEAVKPKKVSKKALDNMFAEIIQLKESKKAIDARLKELLTAAESLYKESADCPEKISGAEFEMTKVPINRGRNTYSPEVVHDFMSRIPTDQRAGLIVIKEEVDPKVMDKLIKAGILTADDADLARVDKWTFSSKFNKKASTFINGNIITYTPNK